MKQDTTTRAWRASPRDLGTHPRSFYVPGPWGHHSRLLIAAPLVSPHVARFGLLTDPSIGFTYNICRMIESKLF